MAIAIVTVRLKKNYFLLRALLLLLDRNCFFTCIRPKQSRSISYNLLYLILVLVKNFAARVTLNVLCLPVK